MPGLTREAKEVSSDHLRQRHDVQPAHHEGNQSLPAEAEVFPQMPAAVNVETESCSRLAEEEG